jgi:PBP1b-binding outer membrane lipoprotein LpoB
MYKMKMVSLVLLPLTIVLSGCLSKIEPDYEAKRALYKKQC